MSTTEELTLVAAALAVIALVNWMMGDRSFHGRELLLRPGAAWVACRWLGLGLWAATLAATGRDDFRLAWVGLAGAALLLFGTARRMAPVRGVHSC